MENARVPGLLDHIFVALIVAGIPLKGVFERRRLMTSQAVGEPRAKLDAYSRIIAWQWSAAAVLAMYWWYAGRSFGALGLRAPTWIGLLVSVAVVSVLVSLLLAQVRSVKLRPEVADGVRQQTEALVFMLPRTPVELRRFTWLGVTAGIVEEFIIRGFLIWYFASFMPWWSALVVSSIVFGIGHLYQGMTGVIKTTAVGLFLGALYWGTRALWASMFLHAAVDVLSGRAVYFAYQGKPPAEEPNAA
jgi:membrane protease YdiL (CAAX protease family)